MTLDERLRSALPSLGLPEDRCGVNRGSQLVGSEGDLYPGLRSRFVRVSEVVASEVIADGLSSYRQDAPEAAPTCRWLCDALIDELKAFRLRAALPRLTVAAGKRLVLGQNLRVVSRGQHDPEHVYVVASHQSEFIRSAAPRSPRSSRRQRHARGTLADPGLGEVAHTRLGADAHLATWQQWTPPMTASSATWYAAMLTIRNVTSAAIRLLLLSTMRGSS